MSPVPSAGAGRAVVAGDVPPDTAAAAWVAVLDPASADVLRFVVPRVADVPVAMVAAERVTPDALPQCRPLCPTPLLVVGSTRRPPAGPADGSRADQYEWSSPPERPV